MEQHLKNIFGFEVFSLLYGFLGYNQVLVSEEDRLKTWNVVNEKSVNCC
jgi:hypothetical protein